MEFKDSIKLSIVNGVIVANLQEMMDLMPHLDMSNRYITMKYALNLLLDVGPLGNYSRVSPYYFEQCINSHTFQCCFLEKEGVRLIFDCLPSLPYGYVETLHDYEGIDEKNLNILFDACELENERVAIVGALLGYDRFNEVKGKSLVSFEEFLRRGLKTCDDKAEILRSFDHPKYSYLKAFLEKHDIDDISDDIVEEIKQNDIKEWCDGLRHFVDVYSTEVIDVVLWRHDLI